MHAAALRVNTAKLRAMLCLSCVAVTWYCKYGLANKDAWWKPRLVKSRTRSTGLLRGLGSVMPVCCPVNAHGCAGLQALERPASRLW